MSSSPTPREAIAAAASVRACTKTVMLTGDAQKVAAITSRKELGVDEVHAELLPAATRSREVEALLAEKSGKA